MESISDDKLIQFSGEHLHYEIMMFYAVFEMIHDKQDNQYVFNALLESFIIHGSIIVDFFYKKQLKNDDAKAIHFVKSVDDWKKVLPPFSGVLKKFNTKRNKELIHLSYKRLDVRVQDRPWKAVDIVKIMSELVHLFLEYCDQDRVHKRLYVLQFTYMKKMSHKLGNG